MIDLSHQLANQRSKSRSRFLRFLFHPLTLVSLGLHGVLLFMPARETQRPQTEEPDAPEEEPIIEVQSLADILGEQPEAPPPEAPPPEPQTQAPPQQQQVLTEVPEDLPPEDLLNEESFEEEIFEEESFDADGETSPNFNADDARSQLSGGFGTLSGATPVEPGPTTFPQNYQTDFFQPDADGNYQFTSSGNLPITSGKKPNIAGWQWLNDTRPENALPEVEQLVANSAQVITPIGEYGGGELYQLTDTAGNQAGFLNIVPGEGRISTIIVIWATDPRG